MKYCLTSEAIGGGIILEYDPGSGIMTNSSIEHVLSHEAATLLARNFPIHRKLLTVLCKSINGRIDEVTEIPTFDMFWQRYNDPRGKKGAIDQWDRLKDSERILAYVLIPRYKQTTPTWQGILMPEQYLKKKRFNDFMR